MRILLISTLYPGYLNQPRKEVTRAIHNYAVEWQKLGHEVKAIVPWIYYPDYFSASKKAIRAKLHAYQENFTMDNIEITRIPLSKIPKMSFSKEAIEKALDQINEHIKNLSFKPEVIVAHYALPSGIIGSELSKQINIPFILGMHTSDVSFYRRKTKVFNKILENCDGLLFRSRKISDFFTRNFSTPDIPKITMPSGIDEKYFIGENEQTQKIKRKNSRIITACSLISLKNIDVLIKAFSRLNRGDLSLTIIGEGQEANRLRKLSSKSCTPDKIHFLGELPHSEVITEMRKADIFVLVSSPETFGIVYLEAMASGCLTLGSKGEGIDGIIKNGYNGFLVKPGNVEQLKEMLLKVINISQKEKQEILTNSLNTVCELTEKKVARKYIDFIESCIKNSSRQTHEL